MHRRCQCILRIQLPLTQTSVYNLNVLLLDHWFNNKAMCNWCSYIKMPLSNWDNLTIGVKKKKKEKEVIKGVDLKKIIPSSFKQMDRCDCGDA